MTGKEALEIMNQLTNIYNNLFNDNERYAFFKMGQLVERLATIVRTDQVSFNPTVDEEEE